jgi:hypothetical protein
VGFVSSDLSMMLDRPLEPYHHWLVVLTVLKNMKVNGKDIYEMENKSHV